ncbi:MAG TPA: hypothetical protein VJP88_02155, partial [Caulobacteraceae bacterium]|nr:hypothetical protein [Caulobacteraceae bacterium]
RPLRSLAVLRCNAFDDLPRSDALARGPSLPNDLPDIWDIWRTFSFKQCGLAHMNVTSHSSQ